MDFSMIKSSMRKIIEVILQKRGYRLTPDNLFNWPTKDKEFLEIYNLQSKYGWREINGPKIQRMYMVRNMLLTTKGMQGDWAECGVFHGSTSLLMAEYNRRYSLLTPGHRIHLFDSFEGLSTPDESDLGTSMVSGDYKVSENSVRDNLSDYNCFDYHAGWIPERFKDVNGRNFSFVHIDVDLYQPVYDSLEYFIPSMIDGGVIMLDDYGCNETPGALLATNEVSALFNQSVIRLPYGQAMIIIRKDKYS